MQLRAQFFSRAAELHACAQRGDMAVPSPHGLLQRRVRMRPGWMQGLGIILGTSIAENKVPRGRG